MHPTQKFKSTILFFIFIASTKCLAFDQSQLQLNEVQLGATLAIQGGGSSLGPALEYMPHYNLTSGEHPVSVGLDLGLTGFNNKGSDNFYVIKYGLSGGYQLSSNFDINLQAGAQTWTSGNGTAFYFGPAAFFRLPTTLWTVIDGFFISYNAVFQSKLANLFTAGINLKI